MTIEKSIMYLLSSSTISGTIKLIKASVEYTSEGNYYTLIIKSKNPLSIRTNFGSKIDQNVEPCNNYVYTISIIGDANTVVIFEEIFENEETYTISLGRFLADAFNENTSKPVHDFMNEFNVLDISYLEENLITLDIAISANVSFKVHNGELISHTMKKCYDRELGEFEHSLTIQGSLVTEIEMTYV